MRLVSAWLAAMLLVSGPLAAQMGATLMGRIVTLKVMTYDNPAEPIFEGRPHANRVTDDVEFGLKTEGTQNNVDVVPILIDIAASRITFDYSTAEPGELAEANFNGYVLDFGGTCDLFWGARVDRDFSTLPMTDNRIFFVGGVLYVNVSALRFDRGSRFAIDLDLSGCGVS